jgi:hypothetical protein
MRRLLHGCSAGPAAHREALDLKSVRELADVVRPIQEGAVGLEVGMAISGTVGGDDASPALAGDGIIGVMFQPGPGRPMEIEHGLAVWIAVFGVGERAPIPERDAIYVGCLSIH